MLILNKPPVDYRLCNQTVTVYHREGDGQYTRTVYPRAFLDFKKVRNVDKTGSSEASSFLLIIPGDRQTVVPGDKILLGEGGPVTTREEWANLIPSKVPGLVVAKYTDVKYWGTQIVHTEAGG